MSQSQRQQRLRLLFKKLNRERKRQARQIDILCHDLLGAQRAFVQRLDGVGFAASFYKSLLGAIDLRTLLVRADQLIRDELPETAITFYLREPESREMRAFNAHESLRVAGRPLEDCFPAELTASICKANRPCTMNELFAMGLEGNLRGLRNISLATLPLNDLGRPLGFLLIARAIPSALSTEELRKIGLITCGLSRAIAASRQPVHTAH